MITSLGSALRRRLPAISSLWPLWVALGLGCALRLYRLGAQSIWYDEGVSLYLARQTLSGLLRHTAADIHPPLYYLVLHFWIRLVGDAEFAVALLSAAWGLLLIALVYHVGARLADRRVGWIAAGLVALSPFNLWYSQEIRMYTMGAFLGLAAVWYGLRWVTTPSDGARDGPRVAGPLYVLAAAAGLYTLYYFAFLLIAFNLWVACRLLRRPGERCAWPRWMAAQVAVLALYTPWLPIAVRQVLHPPVPPWRSIVPLWSVLVQSWNALSFGQSANPGQVWLALLFVLILFGLGLWSAWRWQAGAGSALLACMVGPVALIVLFSLWTPLFHVRYVFTYSPAFYLLLAAGMARLIRRMPALAWISAMLWVAVSGYSVYEFHTSPLYAADDFRSAVRDIADRAAPGDALLINAGYAYPPFLYYHRDPVAWRGRLVDYQPSTEAPQGLVVLQTGSIGGGSDLGWGRPDADFYATDEDQTGRALARVFAAHPRVWVLRAYDTVVDPGGFIRAWLDAHGWAFEDHVYPGESYIRVQGYSTRREPRQDAPALSHPTAATFDGRLAFLGWSAASESARGGESWRLNLAWQTRERMAADYRFAVELVDGQGRVWAREDRMLVGNAYPTSRWLQDEVLEQPVRLRAPVGIPIGLYTLQVFVYDPTKQEALAVVDARGRSPSGVVSIGHLAVVD